MINIMHSARNKTYFIKDRIFFLADSSSYNTDDHELFERHLSDLYPFFIKKLSQYVISNSINEAEEKDLKEILDEIIDARRSLNA